VSIQVGDGTVVVALVFVGDGSEVVRQGAVFGVGDDTVVVPLRGRVQPDRLTFVGDGAVVVALVDVGDAAAVVGIGDLRVQPDRLTVVSDRVVIVSPVRVGVAAVVIRPPVLRVQPDRLIVVGDGVVVVALIEVGVTAIVVRDREVLRAQSRRQYPFGAIGQLLVSAVSPALVGAGSRLRRRRMCA